MPVFKLRLRYRVFSILQFYLFRHVVVKTTICLCILSFLVWLTQILRFLPLFFQQRFGISDFLIFVSFLLPDLMLFCLPTSFAFGVVWELYQKWSAQELIAMQASGYNLFKLGHPLSLAACAFATLSLIVSIYILPISTRMMRDTENNIRAKFSLNFLTPMQVYRIGHFNIFIQKRHADGSISGVMIHEQKNQDNTLVLAKHGQIQDAPGQNVDFILHDGLRQVISSTQKTDPALMQFKTYRTRLALPNSNRMRLVKLHEKHLSELFFPDENLTLLEKIQHKSEGHQRLMWSFILITFACLISILLLRFAPQNCHRRQFPTLFWISPCLCIVWQSIVFTCLHPTSFFTYSLIIAYILLIAPCVIWRLMR